MFLALPSSRSAMDSWNRSCSNATTQHEKFMSHRFMFLTGTGATSPHNPSWLWPRFAHRREQL